jgi:DNA (cytosine-5)-methyltransferase 1
MKEVIRNVDIHPRMLNLISLCTGIGGIELGLRFAIPNLRSICYVEREAFAGAILAERMQDGLLDAAPIWTDARTFDGKPWHGIVDIVVAGYPCQPFSTMGKGAGISDERFIWDSVKRIISETEPVICFFENVPQHLDIGFDIVYRDLSTLGYGVQAGLFSADEVGIHQGRKRLFIMAYAQGEHARSRELEQILREQVGGRIGGLDGGEIPEVDGEGPCYEGPPSREDEQNWRRFLVDHPQDQPAFFSDADELAAGVVESERVDRERQIRALGNGVVPACAAYAFSILCGKARDVAKLGIVKETS